MRGIQVKVVHTCELQPHPGAADRANPSASRAETHLCTSGAPRYTPVPLHVKYTYGPKGFLVYE
jgi:hypothetical protein